MIRGIIGFALMTILSGCAASSQSTPQLYAFPEREADWIINGEAVQFEGEPWYPRDEVDVLLDSEVFLVGEHQSVQIFVEKIDVRPYERLYTKFGPNRFRVFMKKPQNDQGQ